MVKIILNGHPKNPRTLRATEKLEPPMFVSFFDNPPAKHVWNICKITRQLYFTLKKSHVSRKLYLNSK